MGGYANSMDLFGEQRARKNLARELDKNTEANAKAAMQEAQQAQGMDAEKKLEQIRRQEAALRARFGAQGVSSRGGSANAVISGIYNDAQRAINAQRASLLNEINKISGALQNNRRLNLLAESTDLARRNSSALRSGLRNIPLIGGFF